MESVQSPGVKVAIEPYPLGPADHRAIDCLINGEYSVTCHQSDTDVYVPFSFLAKYFEVRE